MLSICKQSLSVVAIVLALAIFGITQDGPKEKGTLPLEQMTKAIQESPILANQSFYYDDGFRALGSFAVHDHFGKRTCIGYLVSDGKKLAYRYIRAMPGLGSSNDAFETEVNNLARVEYKFYEASRGIMDFYPERLSVKLKFKNKITGLLANWEKADIKFDIWDVKFGKKLMEYINTAGIPAVEKD
jgi:hypothetical protein